MRVQLLLEKNLKENWPKLVWVCCLKRPGCTYGAELERFERNGKRVSKYRGYVGGLEP